MNLADALQTLGLTGETEFEPLTLKRAYLKQVKAHPPEGDPSGFQRVREAYDLVRNVPPLFLRERVGAPSHTPNPTDAEAEAILVEDETESLDERAAEAADRAPEPAPKTDGSEAPERSTLLRSSPVVSVYQRMEDALRDERPKVAAKAMLEIYSAADVTTRVPAPAIVLDTILELFIAGADKRARKLLAAFDRHMTLVAVPLSPAVGAKWQMLRELAAISGFMTLELMCALARSIESGQFLGARKALREEIAEVGREDLELRMRAQAPSLFGAAWPEEPRRTQNRLNGGIGWPIRIALLVMYGFVHMFSFTDRVTISDDYRPARNTPASASPGAHVEVAASVGAGLTELDRERLGQLIQKTDAAYLGGKCNELPSDWAEYRTLVHQLRTMDAVTSEYSARRARAIAICPELVSELPEQP